MSEILFPSLDAKPTHLEISKKSTIMYKVDSLLSGITAQQKGPPVRWYSNKTSLNPQLNPRESNINAL